MGECGCYMCGHTYKLPGPAGVDYLIRLMPSCQDCDVGSTVQIEAVPKGHEWVEVAEVKSLPVTYDADGVKTTMIRAGLSRSELVELAEKCAFDGIDEIDAGVMADEMYDEMRGLSVVMPHKKEEDDG